MLQLYIGGNKYIMSKKFLFSVLKDTINEQLYLSKHLSLEDNNISGQLRVFNISEVDIIHAYLLSFQLSTICIISFFSLVE